MEWIMLFSLETIVIKVAVIPFMSTKTPFTGNSILYLDVSFFRLGVGLILTEMVGNGQLTGNLQKMKDAAGKIKRPLRVSDA
jgi:hypothetical protein